MTLSRYGEPTRARDVLRYLQLVDITGAPTRGMVYCVAEYRKWVAAGNAPYSVDQLTYGHYCRAVGGWREGGPGDLLRKAIAIAEIGGLEV